MGPSHSSGDKDMTPEEMELAFDPRRGREMGRQQLWTSHALTRYSVLRPDDPDRAEALRRVTERRFASPQEDRAVGAMLGMAIGDALGAPLEFADVRYGSTELTGFDPKIWKLRDYNRFQLKPGQWTDDAAMGLCLADSLLVHQGLDAMDLRLRFQNWWLFGYNNAFGYDDARAGKDSVGLGGNISMSIEEFIHDTAAGERTSKGDANTSGNGSVMRNGPVVTFFWDDEAKAMEAAERQSYTTHKGTEAAECCRLLTFACVAAVKEGDGTPAAMVAALDRFRSPLYALQCLAQSRAEERHPENEALRLNLADRNWNWKDPHFRFSQSRSDQQPGYIGSYAMDALAMALHCVSTTDSFEAALLKSANLRGDSDSVTSVVGQLAGAVYGASAIPPAWLQAVQQWDNHGDIAVRAYKLFHRHPIHRAAPE